MESIFRQLERAGKADVETLLKWMKDSKVVATLRDEQTQALFKDVVDVKRVELEEFNDVLAKAVTDQTKTVQQISDQLAAEAPKLFDAASAGVKAFQEALQNKPESQNKPELQDKPELQKKQKKK